MYDKILVPLDGSKFAEVALYYAEGLAGNLGSKLTLVYVSDPNDYTSPNMYEGYLREAVKRAKANAEQVAARRGGGEIEVDYKILHGYPADEIVDYADKANIDLIVLSPQGKSGEKRWDLGGVANRIMRTTRRQVFLARAKGFEPEVHKGKLEKVLVPVDGSKESESPVKYVEYMAAKLGLEVTLLHVFISESSSLIWSRESAEKYRRLLKSSEAYIKKLTERLKAEGLKVNPIFKEIEVGDVAEEIIKISEEGDYSLVAMATHGRSGVGRWIFGSNANKVLNYGSTPLLLVRPTKRKRPSK